MCCQIPLWCGLAVRLFSDNKIIYTIVYVGCAFVTFYFLYHYESNLAQHFMPKANKSVYILGILPLCYYLFDYASTIYTDMLYTSNEFVVQFMIIIKDKNKIENAANGRHKLNYKLDRKSVV